MEVVCSVLCDAQSRKVGNKKRRDRKEWQERGGSQSGGEDDVGEVG